MLAGEQDIPWTQVARMRDHLAHRYFDTSHAILQATVDHDLPDLEQTVKRLEQRLADDRDTGGTDRPAIAIRRRRTYRLCARDASLVPSSEAWPSAAPAPSGHMLPR